MSIAIPPEILALPAVQRMELAALIWDSVLPAEVELSDEHRRILDERLARHRANPTEGRTWDEVKADLFKDR